MATAVIAGAFIGAMASAAVHGFRGGSGNGAFLAMLGGAAGGAVGGYASGPLLGTLGGAAGSGATLVGEAAAYGGVAGGMGFGAGGAAGALGGSVLGGFLGGSMPALISSFSKVAVGVVSPDYPQKQISPDFSLTYDPVKRAYSSEGDIPVFTKQQAMDMSRAISDRDTYLGRALENTTQGTGENGMITYEDVFRSVDPYGLSPSEGEMNNERWAAMSPLYAELIQQMYTPGGYRSRAQAGDIDDIFGRQFTAAPISPLDKILSTGHLGPTDQYILTPEDTSGFAQAGRDILEKTRESLGLSSQDPLGITGNENILPEESSPDSDYLYTAPPASTDATPESSSSQVDYARVQAKQKSFAAARASEESMRSQSLLKTQKSLNLPRFDEEYKSASQRYTDKPKPF